MRERGQGALELGAGGLVRQRDRAGVALAEPARAPPAGRGGRRSGPSESGVRGTWRGRASSHGAGPVLQCAPMSPNAPASATALVTGASRGLGRGIAEALSRDGLDRGHPLRIQSRRGGGDGGRLPQGRHPGRAEVRARRGRHREDGRPPPDRGRDPGRARPHRRPRQQRRDGPARPRRHRGGDGGELRRADRGEPQGARTSSPSSWRGIGWNAADRPPCPAATSSCSCPPSPPRAPPSTAASTASRRPAWPWLSKLWAVRLAAEGRAGLRAAPGRSWPRT